MRSKPVLVLTAVLLVACFLAGCGGISQEQYDNILAQFSEAQQKIDEAQGIAAGIEAEKEAALADLEDARAQAEALEAQVASLREQYELVGATKAETAEKIVRNYFETHVYSTIDMFTCGDMASEVWNVLKAHDIDAIIVVGNKDTAVSGILESNHAWVLAEVAPGEYLALETTAGVAVPKTENALYYYGWSFDSPSDMKSHTTLVREYNTILVLRNQIAEEVNEAANKYNNSMTQAEADKWMAVYEKLKELQATQENSLNEIKAEIDSLAIPLQ